MSSSSRVVVCRPLYVVDRPSCISSLVMFGRPVSSFVGRRPTSCDSRVWYSPQLPVSV